MVPLTSIMEDFRIDPPWPAMQSNSSGQRLEQLFSGNYRVRSLSPARPAGFLCRHFQTITTFVAVHRSRPSHDPIRNVDHVDDQQPLIENKRQAHGVIEAKMKSEQRTTEQGRHAAIEQRQWRA